MVTEEPAKKSKVTAESLRAELEDAMRRARENGDRDAIKAAQRGLDQLKPSAGEVEAAERHG